MIIIQQALMHQYDNNTIKYKLFNGFEAENINI